MIAIEIKLQRVFILLNRDITIVSEVQHKIYVVCLEFNTLPSELKRLLIWVRPSNHLKINYWQVSGINFQQTSINDLQCLIQVTALILTCVESSFWMISIFIREILPHRLRFCKLWETIECWQQNGSCESNSYISQIINRLNERSGRQ